MTCSITHQEIDIVCASFKLFVYVIFYNTYIVVYGYLIKIKFCTSRFVGIIIMTVI